MARNNINSFHRRSSKHKQYACGETSAYTKGERRDPSDETPEEEVIMNLNREEKVAYMKHLVRLNAKAVAGDMSHVRPGGELLSRMFQPHPKEKGHIPLPQSRKATKHLDLKNMYSKFVSLCSPKSMTLPLRNREYTHRKKIDKLIKTKKPEKKTHAKKIIDTRRRVAEVPVPTRQKAKKAYEFDPTNKLAEEYCVRALSASDISAFEECLMKTELTDEYLINVIKEKLKNDDVLDYLVDSTSVDNSIGLDSKELLPMWLFEKLESGQLSPDEFLGSFGKFMKEKLIKVCKRLEKSIIKEEDTESQRSTNVTKDNSYKDSEIHFKYSVSDKSFSASSETFVNEHLDDMIKYPKILDKYGNRIETYISQDPKESVANVFRKLETKACGDLLGEGTSYKKQRLMNIKKKKAFHSIQLPKCETKNIEQLVESLGLSNKDVKPPNIPDWDELIKEFCKRGLKEILEEKTDGDGLNEKVEHKSNLVNELYNNLDDKCNADGAIAEQDTTKTPEKGKKMFRCDGRTSLKGSDFQNFLSFHNFLKKEEIVPLHSYDKELHVIPTENEQERRKLAPMINEMKEIFLELDALKHAQDWDEHLSSVEGTYNDFLSSENTVDGLDLDLEEYKGTDDVMEVEDEHVEGSSKSAVTEESDTLDSEDVQDVDDLFRKEDLDWLPYDCFEDGEFIVDKSEDRSSSSTSYDSVFSFSRGGTDEDKHEYVSSCETDGSTTTESDTTPQEGDESSTDIEADYIRKGIKYDVVGRKTFGDKVWRLDGDHIRQAETYLRDDRDRVFSESEMSEEEIVFLPWKPYVGVGEEDGEDKKDISIDPIPEHQQYVNHILGEMEKVYDSYDFYDTACRTVPIQVLKNIHALLELKGEDAILARQAMKLCKTGDLNKACELLGEDLKVYAPYIPLIKNLLDSLHHPNFLYDDVNLKIPPLKTEEELQRAPSEASLIPHVRQLQPDGRGWKKRMKLSLKLMKDDDLKDFKKKLEKLKVRYNKYAKKEAMDLFQGENEWDLEAHWSKRRKYRNKPCFKKPKGEQPAENTNVIKKSLQKRKSRQGKTSKVIKKTFNDYLFSKQYDKEKFSEPEERSWSEGDGEVSLSESFKCNVINRVRDTFSPIETRELLDFLDPPKHENKSRETIRHDGRRKSEKTQESIRSHTERKCERKKEILHAHEGKQDQWKSEVLNLDKKRKPECKYDWLHLDGGKQPDWKNESLQIEARRKPGRKNGSLHLDGRRQPDRKNETLQIDARRKPGRKNDSLHLDIGRKPVLKNESLQLDGRRKLRLKNDSLPSNSGRKPGLKYESLQLDRETNSGSKNSFLNLDVGRKSRWKNEPLNLELGRKPGRKSDFLNLDVERKPVLKIESLQLDGGKKSRWENDSLPSDGRRKSGLKNDSLNIDSGRKPGRKNESLEFDGRRKPGRITDPLHLDAGRKPGWKNYSLHLDGRRNHEWKNNSLHLDGGRKPGWKNYSLHLGGGKTPGWRNESVQVDGGRKHGWKNDSLHLDGRRKSGWKNDSLHLEPGRKPGWKNYSLHLGRGKTPGRRNESVQVDEGRKPGWKSDSLHHGEGRKPGEKNSSLQVLEGKKLGRENDSLHVDSETTLEQENELFCSDNQRLPPSKNKKMDQNKIKQKNEAICFDGGGKQRSNSEWINVDNERNLEPKYVPLSLGGRKFEPKIKPQHRDEKRKLGRENGTIKLNTARNTERNKVGFNLNEGKKVGRKCESTKNGSKKESLHFDGRRSPGWKKKTNFDSDGTPGGLSESIHHDGGIKAALKTEIQADAVGQNSLLESRHFKKHGLQNESINFNPEQDHDFSEFDGTKKLGNQNERTEYDGVNIPNERKSSLLPDNYDIFDDRQLLNNNQTLKFLYLYFPEDYQLVAYRDQNKFNKVLERTKTAKKPQEGDLTYEHLPLTPLHLEKRAQIKRFSKVIGQEVKPNEMLSFEAQKEKYPFGSNVPRRLDPIKVEAKKKEEPVVKMRKKEEIKNYVEENYPKNEKMENFFYKMMTLFDQEKALKYLKRKEGNDKENIDVLLDLYCGLLSEKDQDEEFKKMMKEKSHKPIKYADRKVKQNYFSWKSTGHIPALPGTNVEMATPQVKDLFEVEDAWTYSLPSLDYRTCGLNLESLDVILGRMLREDIRGYELGLVKLEEDYKKIIIEKEKGLFRTPAHYVLHGGRLKVSREQISRPAPWHYNVQRWPPPPRKTSLIKKHSKRSLGNNGVFKFLKVKKAQKVRQEGETALPIQTKGFRKNTTHLYSTLDVSKVFCLFCMYPVKPQYYYMIGNYAICYECFKRERVPKEDYMEAGKCYNAKAIRPGYKKSKPFCVSKVEATNPIHDVHDFKWKRELFTERFVDSYYFGGLVPDPQLCKASKNKKIYKNFEDFKVTKAEDIENEIANHFRESISNLESKRLLSPESPSKEYEPGSGIKLWRNFSVKKN